MAADYRAQLETAFRDKPWLLRDYGSLTRVERNMDLLERHGLSQLNTRLLGAGRQFPERLGEHNIAAWLLANEFRNVVYEPEEFTQPPDFEAHKSGAMFLIEVKRLGTPEDEAQLERMFLDLKRQLASVNTPLCVYVRFRPDFPSNLTAELRRYIASVSAQPDLNVEYAFPNSTTECMATFEFYTTQTIVAHLTARTWGQLAPARLDTRDRKRVRQRVRHAYEKFKALEPPSGDRFHLVLIETETFIVEDIEIASAIYGTERNASPHRATVERAQDGFFSGGKHSKLTGLITFERHGGGLVPEYARRLFMNPQFAACTPTVAAAFNVEGARVVRPEMLL